MLSGGSLDTSFGLLGTATYASGSGPTVSATIVQSDGKIIEAGSTYNGADTDMTLVRFNTNGSADTGFGSGGEVVLNFASQWDSVTALAVQSDGKILAGGYNAYVSGGTSYSTFALARFNSNGTLDTSFGAGGEVTTDFGTIQCNGRALVVQSDGKIVLAGNNLYASTNTDFAIARYNSDGSLDTSFGTGGKVITDFSGVGISNPNDSVTGAALQSDGKIVVVGNSNNQIAIARYNTDGSLDTGFNSTGKLVSVLDSGGQCAAIGVGLTSDGKIVVGGERDNVAAVARYTSSGALDTTFNTTGYVTNSTLNGNATGVAVQADNKILLTGQGAFNLLLNTFSVARYNTDGSVDSGFGSSGIASMTMVGLSQAFQTGLAIEADGKVVLSGSANFLTNYILTRFTLTNAPTANAGGPYPLNEGDSTTLSGASSSDPDGEALTYQWDLNYNGSSFNPTASGVSPTFSAAAIAGTSTRTVALRAVDVLGMPSASLSTATVTINHVNPTITLASTQSFNEGTTVNLSATVGDDGFHDPFTYNWHVTTTNGQSISDGSTLTYPITLLGDGTYTGTLTVTDHSGAHVSATTTITSVHVSPTVGVSGPSQATRDAWTTWSLSASGPGITSGYEPITSWTINWGDKKYDGSNYIETFTGNPSSETHNYDSAGTYTVSATATDKDGTYTATQTVIVATGTYYDLAAGQTIYASSGSSAGNAVDSNSSTQWTSSTASAGEWIFVDLGGMTDINRVKLTWGTNYAATFKLRVSNDAADWKDLSAIITSSGTVDDLTGFTTDARYLLVQMLTPKSGASNYQLASFEAYGGDLAYSRAYDSSNPNSADLNGILATAGTGLTNAVDSDGTTQWTSAAGGAQYIIVDLNDAVNVNLMRLWFGAHYAATYRISVGDDTVHWVTMGGERSGHAGLNEISLAGVGRYVLLSFDTTASGASNYQVNDIAIYGTNNLATGQSTTASSSVSGGAASQATDTDSTTAWISASDSTHTTQQSLTVDLGDVYNVSVVQITWGSDYATAFAIQTSNDGTTFTTANSFTGQTGAVLGTGVLVNARYVRVLCTGYSTNRFSIKDLAIMGLQNLADVHNAAASSYTGTNYGTNATDEDLSTQWISNGSVNQWLLLDLGTSVSISALNIDWGAAYAATFQISVSSDGVHWTTMSSGGTTTFNGTNGGTFISGLSGTGRYILISCLTTAPGQSNFDVQTAQVFGYE